MKKFMVKLIFIMVALVGLGAVQASVLTLGDWSRQTLGSHTLVQANPRSESVVHVSQMGGASVDESPEGEPSGLRIFLCGALLMAVIAVTRMRRD
jgi:hypothetical protein